MRFVITSIMKMITIAVVLAGLAGNAKADWCLAVGTVEAIWVSDDRAAIRLIDSARYVKFNPYKPTEWCDCHLIGDNNSSWTWSWIDVSTDQGFSLYTTLLSAKLSEDIVEVRVDTGPVGTMNDYSIACKVISMGIID